MEIVAERKPRKQADRREEAESRLIKAAMKLIAMRGYDEFTLADVGKEAGYSRGLAAHYFGLKETLLMKVADTVVIGYRAGLEREPSGERGMPEIERMLRRYARNATTLPARTMSILASAALVRPEIGEAFRLLNNQSIERIEEELRAGIEQGNIAATIDLAPQARMIFSFMRGLLQFACFERNCDTAKIAEAFLNGLGSAIGTGQSARSDNSISL